MVLYSAEDQCRIPVTFGNFEISCAVAGELSGSPASVAELLSSVAGFVVAPVGAWSPVEGNGASGAFWVFVG